ncbi:MAG: radical SAM protein [Roseiflexaceae bacterium]|nr:radical SAM protein [Roseiflexaceae bacterium]
MELAEKLEILAPAARFDACDTHSSGGKRFTPKKAAWDAAGIAAESGPDGRAMPVFRLLMSSKCEWDCPYCPLRSANDTPRAALTPEELAQAFMPRVERGAAQGLLLSTGVDSDQRAATTRMIDGVEQLRRKNGFDGYVHLKLLPGTSRSDVERAARLASRISINIEAPSAEQLAAISPRRDWFADVIAPLLWARDWQREGLLPSGIATQFVVGAAGEADRDLLRTTAWLYRDLDLRRVYFGAFRPAAGTPLADRLPTPFVREQRLKEADWLLRHYGFATDELPYDAGGNLPLNTDPKLAWALAHPELFPVELNTAAETLLMRVPGLGPLSVRRILRLRRDHCSREPAQLKGLGSLAGRAADFVTLNGRFFGRDHAARMRHYAAPKPIVEQLTRWG